MIIDTMGTLQDDFITDIEKLPKELQERINNGLQNQIIKEAELVKNDMPDYYLSYLNGEIGKAGASMQRMIEESGRDGALLANISMIYVWNKERRKTLYNLKETYQRDNEQVVKQPQPEAQITAHEPQQGTKQKYFDKAIEAGFMEKTATGYKWLFGGNMGLVRLGYFIHKIYDDIEAIPYKRLEAMFGVKRLDSALQRALESGQIDKVKKWKEKIDSLVQSV